MTAARRVAVAILVALFGHLWLAPLSAPALACTPGRLIPSQADAIAEGWVAGAHPVNYVPLGAWTPAVIVVEVARPIKGDVPNPLRFVSAADWLPGMTLRDLEPDSCRSKRIFGDDPHGQYGIFVLSRRAGSLRTAPDHGNRLGHGPDDPGIDQARDYIRAALRTDPTTAQIVAPDPIWLAWLAPVVPILVVLGAVLFIAVAGFGNDWRRTRNSRQ